MDEYQELVEGNHSHKRVQIYGRASLETEAGKEGLNVGEGDGAEKVDKEEAVHR
jgi:hypothetical protein